MVPAVVRLGVGLGLEADLAIKLKSWLRTSLSPLLPSFSSRQLLLITARRPALEFITRFCSTGTCTVFDWLDPGHSITGDHSPLVPYKPYLTSS